MLRLRKNDDKLGAKFIYGIQVNQTKAYGIHANVSWAFGECQKRVKPKKKNILLTTEADLVKHLTMSLKSRLIVI